MVLTKASVDRSSIGMFQMGKRKDLSTKQKSSVIALIRNTEYSQRGIARKCGVSQSSIKRLSKKVQMNQPVTAARAGVTVAANR